MNQDNVNNNLNILKKYLSDYQGNKISLNRLIISCESIIAPNDMSGIRKIILPSINILEEINASVFEGASISEVDAKFIDETIEKMILDIENTI